MSLFEELILERCPEGVIFKALGDVCIVKTGPNINKQIIADNPGPYPVINSGREPLGYVDQFNTEDDPIGIASRGSVGLVTWTLGRFFRGNLNYSCTTKNPSQLDARFIYYYLLYADSEIQQLATHQGIPALNASALKTLQIPVPPKEVQAEVVRILDAFTELTAELTAELNARKKQFNYYRDQLLSFEDGEVEWKTLGEVCEIGDGNHSSKYPRSDEMVDEGVPFIRGTNMVDGTISWQDMKFITPQKHQELKKGHLKAHDVLIANRGEIGKIAQVPEQFSGSNLNSQLAWLRAKLEIISPRYLYYALNASHVQSGITGEGGALQQLTIKNIKLIKIPIPSLNDQARIVTILDKFDALTNSITGGVPREIELRQKQFAYYRDLLLSFPKPQAAVA